LSDSKSKLDTKVGLYGRVYGNFASKVYAEIRREAFGEDIGQFSWLTSVDQDRFFSWLNLNSGSRVLDVCCGAGGPTLRLAKLYGCTVIGIDAEEKGIASATAMAESQGLSGLAKFEVADATRELPFEKDTFDLLVCIDAINHFPVRESVFAEWARVVKRGGMVLFTDPTIVTGQLSSQEISARSSYGYNVLPVPLGEDERLLELTGLRLVKREDLTENMAILAKRRFAARGAREDALKEIEGSRDYQAQQEFLRVVELLARERRLSRFVYLAQKPV
jgi:SAM-dependent methyltransferase